MTFTFLYVTTKDESEAQRLSKHLLQKRLIACANIFPVKSMYWWKGKITSQQEVVLILKTTEGKADAVKQEIERMHSCEIPCITKIPVVPNAKYARWVSSLIQPAPNVPRHKS